MADSTTGKIAVVIGATGLVGSELVSLLLEDSRFTKVLTLVRKPSGRSHPKLEERVIDFQAPEGWSPLVAGDVAFSALGTTLKQAGSQAEQRRVDYDYQLAFAKAAAENGIRSYVLCSAAGANPKSRMFYSRLKGELDRDVQQLGFECVRIFRPSLLGGQRANARSGEGFSSVVLGALNAIGVARKYREIHGRVVAQAMLNAGLDPAPGTRVFTLDEIFDEAGRVTV